MKRKTIIYFIVACLIFLLVVIADKTVNAPLKTFSFNNGEIIFDKNIDGFDIIFKSAFDNNTKETTVYSFGAEGSAPANIASVLLYPIKGESNIIVITKWRIRNSALGVSGNNYEIVAFEKNNNSIIKNKIISEDHEMRGFNGNLGDLGGKSVFKYNDINELKKYIDKKYNS